MLNPFRRLFQTEIKSGIANPEPWLIELFGGGQSQSGIVVTPHNAMRCTPVRCAVQAIAETVGQLSTSVYETPPNGDKKIAPDHPAHVLLHDETNEFTSAFQFKETLIQDALLHRVGGVAFINRIDSRPVEIQRLDPELVTSTVNQVTGEPLYVYNDPLGAKRTFVHTDIIHIKSPSLTGHSLIEDAKEAIGLALVMEAHAARLFGNGARPSGLLSLKGNPSSEAMQRAKAAWQGAHGSSNSGKVAVLPGDVSWNALTFSSVDAQFNELRTFAVAEIARIFRVPPIFLQDYGRATWANSEDMGQQFLTYCLMPWIKRLEGEFRLKLLTPDERKTYSIEFCTDDLLRADFDQRMQGYTAAIASRILSPNEARAKENLPPYEGGNVYSNPNIDTNPNKEPKQ